MFKFKKIQEETKEAMIKAITNDYDENCENKIKKLTNHENVIMTNSGNASIFLGLLNTTETLLIPEQGGWHGFKQIGKLLNKKITEIKTNKGLINLEELNNYKDTTLILTSYAGYTAKQDIKNISKICKENNIILIEDASAGIGNKKKEIANGKFSDIILASTGQPKLINVGNGGFLTTNNKEIIKKIKIPKKITKINKITLAGIDVELNYVEKRLKDTVNANNYLKNNIDNVIHKEKEGVNVIISHKNQKDFAWYLKNNLKINEKNLITTCPNYNRIKEKAVSIETKNLNYDCLTKENLDKIIEISNQQQI